MLASQASHPDLPHILLTLGDFGAGNVHLLMPSMQVDDVDVAINDNEVVAELEHVMSEWCAALTDVMQREVEKHPIGSGPLAGLCS